MGRYLSIYVLVIFCLGGNAFRSVKADEGEGIEGLAEAIPIFEKQTKKENLETSGPLEIGFTKQLLVDDYIVAEKRNVTRQLGKITKENDGSPVMVADKPWEHANRLGFLYDCVKRRET